MEKRQRNGQRLQPTKKKKKKTKHNVFLNMHAPSCPSPSRSPPPPYVPISTTYRRPAGDPSFGVVGGEGTLVTTGFIDGVNAVAPPSPLEATPVTAGIAKRLTGGGATGGTGAFSWGGGNGANSLPAVRAGGFGGLMLLSLPRLGDSGSLVGSLFEAGKGLAHARMRGISSRVGFHCRER